MTSLLCLNFLWELIYSTCTQFCWSCKASALFTKIYCFVSTIYQRCSTPYNNSNCDLLLLSLSVAIWHIFLICLVKTYFSLKFKIKMNSLLHIIFIYFSDSFRSAKIPKCRTIWRIRTHYILEIKKYIWNFNFNGNQTIFSITIYLLFMLLSFSTLRLFSLLLFTSPVSVPLSSIYNLFAWT